MNNIGITRRGAARAALALVASSLLASCATFIGPREVELPLAKLQAGLDRRFPVDNRMLELFNVRLSRPVLSLIPERDRVALTMHAAVAPPFLSQSWHGALDLSGRLYVDAARGAVFMAEPRVDRFAIDGINESYQRQLTSAANVLMDKVIGDVPVYSFRMEDLRYGGVQFVPTRMTTTSRGLVVTLEPVK
ncbi:MAG TPA: DUF1439 domain-containing protein [Telluria sp.]